MAQKPQIVDLTKSYLVTDPNAFLENLVNTDREDGEESVFPILPYEGYNFLPTDYGYRSYFGQNANFNLSALTSRTQFILSYQGADLRNWLIALCEDGIWIADTSVGGSWSQAVVHAFDANIFEQWTWTILEDALYMYKQGGGVVYKTQEAPTTFNLQVTNFTPSFLNMDGQIGIFKAGTRLGFWDSLNSIAWSNTFDFADFTPSLETLAGNMILNEVVGSIVAIKESGEGFVVYSSGAIIGASLHSDTNLVWDTKKILNVGVLNPRSVCFGRDNSEHWAWTTGGILILKKYVPISGKYEYEFVLPEVYDFLKESRNPIYLDCVQNRYICFQVFDGAYIYGRSQTSGSYVNPSTTALMLADEYWDGDIEVLPTILDGNTLRTIFEQWMAGNSPTTMQDSEGCV